jgi:hypothetical protein
VEISATVGMRGVNRPVDVGAIQDALNRIPVPDGGPSPPLEVDSKCGPLTERAIQTFQLRHFGWAGADGRVDPGKQTLAKINEILGRTGGGPRTTIKDVYQPYLRSALECLKAAKFNLDMAQTALPGRAPGPAEPDKAQRLALLEKHFALLRLPHPQAEVFRLQGIIHTMRTVFERPGGLWGWSAFEASGRLPWNSRTIAYTGLGGYFRAGEKYGRIRVDAIHLVDAPEFWGQRTRGFYIRTIIHELTHFVSGGAYGPLEDHGYGWVDDPRMKRLTAWQMVHNAESIANYAFDARYRGSEPP